jgi:protein TonB
MITLSPDHSGDTRRHIQSWALSLLLHIGAVAAGLALVANVHLAPQPEPFRWTVSVVEAPPSDQTAQAVVSADAATPRQTVAADAHPVAPAAQPELSVEPPSPLQPIARQEITRPTPVQAPEPVSSSAAIVQTPTASQTEAPPAPSPAITEPATEEARPTEPVQSEPVDPPVVAGETPHQSEQHEVASLTRTTTSEAATAPSAFEPSSALMRAAELPAATPPAMLAPQQGTPAKADYGWLAQALWNRIEKLKRYPHLARLNHWEGRVVLRVVVSEDGNLVDLAVAKSSGHSVLDQDAMDVLKQASPLSLPRPLGKSQVVVQIPISYRLD